MNSQILQSDRAKRSWDKTKKLKYGIYIFILIGRQCVTFTRAIAFFSFIDIYETLTHTNICKYVDTRPANPLGLNMYGSLIR